MWVKRKAGKKRKSGSVFLGLFSAMITYVSDDNITCHNFFQTPLGIVLQKGDATETSSQFHHCLVYKKY